MISWGSQPPDPAKRLRLRRSFRKSVSIYPRSAPATSLKKVEKQISDSKKSDEMNFIEQTTQQQELQQHEAKQVRQEKRKKQQKRKQPNKHIQPASETAKKTSSKEDMKKKKGTEIEPGKEDTSSSFLSE